MHNNFEGGFMGQPEREIQLQGEEDEMVISCCVIGEQAGLSFRCATPCRYLGYNCSRVMQQRRVNWYTCTVHAMINAFRMNLGVKSFFFFFFLRIQSWFVVNADRSGQETVLSRFWVAFIFFFFFLLEIVISFPVFPFTMEESDILFYMTNFFFNFVKIHSFLELCINIRIIWKIDSFR